MTRSFRHELRAAALAALAVVAVAAAALAAAPAAKHVHLTRSEPGADSTVNASPSSIRLWFSSPAQISVTSVRLTGPDGAGVEVATPHLGEGPNPPVVADVRGRIKPGRQQVAWRTMSRDGHAVSGSFGFTLAPAAAAAGTLR